MKKSKKIFLNIILILLLLFLWEIAFDVFSHDLNKIIFFITLVFLILINSKKFALIDYKRRIIVFSILILIFFAYIIIPKKNTSCGIQKEWKNCTTHYCMGLPIRDLTKPVCLGKTFNESHERIPN